MSGGFPNFGISDEFPILWRMAGEFDFAERLGGCNSDLHAEVDKALRELWDARRAAEALVVSQQQRDSKISETTAPQSSCAGETP